MLFFLAVLTTLLASSSSQNLKNDKPTCMFQQNQTDFNPCVFNTLGGADNQVAACAYFLNTATYQQCLCTKSKAVTECYEQFCPTDFSAPIFTKMFWDFCKGYKSNIPLNGIPTITGIPIVATAAASVTPKANVSRTPSFRPSAAFPQADTGFAGLWMAVSSLIVALIGAVVM